MKKAILLLLIVLINSAAFTQQKHALVIGNSNYTGISRLTNPVNDANDMEAVLKDMGFSVTKVLDGSRQSMENAVVQLKNQLSRSTGSYGFFFYAGHGVQSSGENYLIPVDANIPSENALRDRAVALNWIMAELNDAGNELNFIVLDSCRDNPFSWNRNLSRGLAVVSRAPPGSIIFYATSDGRPASDGTGRNGLFTTQLLNNLKTQGLEITELIRNTGNAVRQSSGGTQIPAVYNQFFGMAYLGTRPVSDSSSAAHNPELAKTHFDRGEIFRNRSEWDAAIREYTEAIRFDINYPEAYNMRGLSYRSKGDHDRAIADFSVAIGLNPNYSWAYRLRGNSHQNKGDFDRAIADQSEAIRINSNSHLAFYNRGNAYRAKGDLDRAIADYTVAIMLNPEYSLAYNNRGLSYSDKGDNDRAIADYTAAIRINPNYALAYNNRGHAYQAKRDTARANADFARARELGYR
ncbi:MAG: tetratricopeptide repeat protein [Treponema sp.]|nr:tetratricopeptide repeat protein [Treponema sp.]